MLKYISTRDSSKTYSFKDVLMAGLAPDGGLFIPEKWPTLDHEELKRLAGAPYSDIAYRVIHPFVDGDIDDTALRNMIEEVYQEEFNHACVAPLVQISPTNWVMELFHGPTLAFKDYALQLLGRLFDHVLEESGERITIIGATSGDTGSAAIEACKNCKHIDIFILHPEGRTSEVQRRQMTTIDSPNVHNIALKGTFDDCQDMVKAMFNDQKFRNDINMSAVNSINWARIMAQIVYYVSSAIALGAPRQNISYAVPTGNFGNVYAAYAAQKMGLPIEKLVIGSNRNDILTRFFETGAMKRNKVEPSLSPSMDIQISSNFERYLCDLIDRDTKSLDKLMKSFKDTGSFSLGPKHMTKARKQFLAHRCDDEQTRKIMRTCYAETGYVLDPHTAVGVYAGLQLRNDPAVPIVALACAHPAKFPDAVEDAIGIRPELPEHLADLYDRQEHVTSLPNDLAKVKDFVKSNI